MATISIHHVRGALASLGRRGRDSRAPAIEAGINPRLLTLPNARIHDRQMTRLIHRISELLDDEFMGCTGRPCKRGAFAYMVQSVRRCENLREAIKSGTRFYNLLTDDIDTQLQEDGEQATIDIRFAQPALDPDHYMQEFWMVIWHRLASWLTDTRIPLLAAEFVQPMSDHQLELSYMFPCPLTFDQHSNRLQFAAEHLNLPIVRSREDVEEFVRHAPFDLLTIPGSDQSLQQQITRLLTPAYGQPLEFPALESLARRLKLSPKTLHRRLKKEATSYQRIKDNLRRDLALNKLIREQLPVHQVAELVGFADARSFTRAFKHWTGLSPREYCRFL
ncbi:MAG: AraC family transcriptional regulator [Gammaproteobacteria bacterium]|uniref:AraC family transcriptional regulator n=1 Tax=Pseudomaricurvus alcaniphilus TaxID=1166482 RepID=UPI0014076F89|nr:AraC family transcriptional regulator [Pseudomaricurvus alcaniphilus]MBR9912853.1 AraC family transcriptional regulator [Gammaproteobacteria bacterium]NHN36137.1 AraC family transcriptional regulator [Pseudomaricurvus alcaniphilus]